MKRNHAISLILIVLLGLGAAAAVFWGLTSKCGNPTEKQGQDTIVIDQQEKIELPKEKVDEETEGHHDLREGERYLVTVDGDTAFVEVQEISGAHVRGYAYITQGGREELVPVPFDFVTRIFSNHLKLGDKEYRFKNGSIMLRGYVDGEEHLLTDKNDKTYRFKADSYTDPEYSIVVDNRYRKGLYKVRVTPDILYGKSEGYWTSKEWDESHNYAKAAFNGIAQTTAMKYLPLRLDLYQPVSNETNAPLSDAPFILFIHGGAFYVGGKDDYAIVNWCKHFASMGYVCASIDYRMGFMPTKDDFVRACYMSVQDAHAAMRFLVHNDKKFGIDKDRLFVAGTSAGAVTALNLAFMTDKDRPDATFGFGRKGQKARVLQSLLEQGDTVDMPTEKQRNRINKKNLGCLAQSGNVMTEPFRIRAVANLWGAVNALDMLGNNPQTDIISFHDDEDPVVPYDEGYAFSDANVKVGKMLIGKLYGSAAITRRSLETGRRAHLITLHGAGHAPHKDNGKLNIQVANMISDSIASFFYEEMVPQPATIESVGESKHYFHVTSPYVAQVMWKVEGGFVTHKTARSIRVVWTRTAPTHRILASGVYKNGIGWNALKEIEM
ncbi:MAG: alpha/beta hydrolase [Bacteroidales bacterium]|nr:alpha/beta hydrolase [Bacteroidales bacterium]